MHTANLELATRTQYANKRRHVRHVLSVPVTLYRYSATGRLLIGHGMSIDISKGGIGVVVCGPPHIGETVILHVQLLESAFEALALVRHSNSTRSGFEFLDLPAEIQNRIEDSIREPQASPWPVNPFLRK